MKPLPVKSLILMFWFLKFFTLGLAERGLMQAHLIGQFPVETGTLEMSFAL